MKGRRILQPAILIPLLAAVISGVAIGAQGTLGSRAGQLIGSLNTGILMHFTGAAGGLLILIALTLAGRGITTWQLTRPAWITVTIAGLLGLVIVTGVSYSWARIGVAAGIATVFFGQMLVGVIVDIFGWNTGQPVPMDWRRLLGLALMVAAVYLLLPRD